MTRQMILLSCLIGSSIALASCSSRDSFQGRSGQTSDTTNLSLNPPGSPTNPASPPTPAPRSASGSSPSRGGPGEIIEDSPEGRVAVAGTAEQMGFCWRDNRFVCNAEEIKLVLDMY